MTLTDITIKAHMKHFKLTVKNGFLYKDNVAIYTEDLTDKERLLSFFEGMSVIYDNKELWRRTSRCVMQTIANMHKTKKYKIKDGVVFGRPWGGGLIGFKICKFQTDYKTLKEAKHTIKECFDKGSLDGGFGFEKLHSTLVLIDEITTITDDGLGYVNIQPHEYRINDNENLNEWQGWE